MLQNKLDKLTIQNKLSTMNIPYIYIGTNNEMHLFRLKLNAKSSKLLLDNYKNPRNRTLKEDKVRQYICEIWKIIIGKIMESQ